MPLCQAIYCSNRRENCPGKSFFAIPDPKKDRERCAVWIRNIETTKFNVETYIYSRFRVVCEDHFDVSAFETNLQAVCLGYKPRKLLKPDAVPTIFSHKILTSKPRPTTVKGLNVRERRKVLSCIDNRIEEHEHIVKKTHRGQEEHLFRNETTCEGETLPSIPEAIEEVEVDSHQDKCIPRKQRKRKRSSQTSDDLVDMGVQTDIIFTRLVDSSVQASVEVFECATQVPGEILTAGQQVAEDHTYYKSVDKQDVVPEAIKTNHPSAHQSQSPVERGPSHTSSPDVAVSDPELDLGFITDSNDTNFSDTSGDDPTYKPVDEESSTDEELNELEEEYVEMRKYVVFEDRLLELIYRLSCPTCNEAVSEVKQIPSGSLLKIYGTCMKGHLVINWSSQPTIERTGVGNLLLAAATLFSGLTHKRMESFANYMGLQYICESSFYGYQKSILLPVINAAYEASQKTVLENARRSIAEGEPLIVSGDGRCDSPGHNAKFGTYSIMNIKTNEILCHALVQVTEASSSNAMEKLGFVRCMDLLDADNLRVNVMATDRHMSIRAALKKDYKDVTHQFDVWHLGKSIKKKLLEKSKGKGCQALAGWIQAISNHLWWAASNCQNNADLLVEMWTSVTHHVTDCHQWTHGELFRRCAHDDLTEEQRSSIAWLEAGSAAHEALVSVVFDRTLLRDIRQITMALNTGGLEQYHGLMLKYCPKRQSFKYPCMQGRTQMAIIDHNHNAERKHATDKQGRKKYTAVYQKATKKWVLRLRYEKKDYSFVTQMMKNVVAVKLGNSELAEPPVPSLPKNIAPIPCPEKEEMILNHRSRFPERD